MSISVTFTADSPSELHSTIATFLVASGAPAPATKTAKAETKTPPKVEEKAPEPDLIDEPSGEVSDADLKAAAIAYQQKNGRDALAAALKQFGAPAGVTSVPADKRAGFVAHCEA